MFYFWINLMTGKASDKQLQLLTINNSGMTAVNYACTIKKHPSAGQLQTCHLFFCLFTKETPIVFCSTWEKNNTFPFTSSTFYGSGNQFTIFS